MDRSRSAQIRAELGYPVLDGDGHVVELFPVFADFVGDHGGGAALEMLTGARGATEGLSSEERRRAGLIPHSWHVPSDTEYYATVASPRLYHERLGEAGIDFAVLYPTMGISLLKILPDEPRVTLCRLYNEFMADQYRPFTDRFTVAALIPMGTPSEAIAGLEHAKGIGAKVGLITSHMRRPVPGQAWPPTDPWARMRVPEWEVHGWLDTFGIDSVYDYDPVWAKAVELNLPLAAHSAGIGFSDRASVSNFVYNQIGHFAASGAALAKSLFLGGVTRRFPQLRIALLEGGAAVGVETFIGLAATWQKRGAAAIRALNPDNIDEQLLHKLLTESDPRLFRYSADQLKWQGGMKEPRDDFEAAGIESLSDVRDLFCTPFYWGCEADDPLVGLAFDSRITPLGAKVPAFFASDLGHWDVVAFDEPLEEAHELVEKGILGPDEFKEFVFTNPVRFYGSLNPDFFRGTSIESDVAAVL
jgi:predicted TIM-barrel fold metal-dependent hydrolase